jgi:hypothetical protein
MCKTITLQPHSKNKKQKQKKPRQINQKSEREKTLFKALSIASIKHYSQVDLY